jgi:hypothetical protein
MKHLLTSLKWTLGLLLLASTMSPLFALGTFSEGQVFLTIRKFESSGIIFESWEGSGEITTYAKDENCNRDENLCYTPKKEMISFSVRPETNGGKLAAELQKSINKEVLVSFRVHRVEALALGTDFEITGVLDRVSNMPADFPAKKATKKTGAKRNFSVHGRILSLEYQGTAVGTYEGLYLDAQKVKVHPFSITDAAMAAHAYRLMALSRDYHLGVSQAFVTGLRKSDYDVFELNLNEPAGAQDVQPQKGEAEKPASTVEPVQ